MKDKKPIKKTEEKPKRKLSKKQLENLKPFTKEYNGANYEKWTEEVVHKLLDELEDWLFEEVPVYAPDGVTVIGLRDKGNCFYNEFLYKKRLYNDWFVYVSGKFASVSERMSNIDKIQEHKLQLLAATGKHKENITKFILSNKYKWSEKVESKVENTTITWNEEKTYSDDKK